MRSPLDYAPPRRRWRVPPAAWAVLVGIVLLVAADQLYERWETRTYLDLSSGDVRHETWFGHWRLRQSVEQTAFARLARQYAGRRPPPNWVFCYGRVGMAYADGNFFGADPSDCASLAEFLDAAHLSEADRKAVVLRCVAALAADQHDPFDAEENRLVDLMSAPAIRP